VSDDPSEEVDDEEDPELSNPLKGLSRANQPGFSMVAPGGGSTSWAELYTGTSGVNAFGSTPAAFA
jgi:hypothetical protein